MSVKAKDIAKQLNISPATLSLILNNKPGISERTRMEVTRRLQDMGYGNLLERNASACGNRIGFVIFKNGGQLLGMNSFFPLILEGIEQVCRAHSCTLQIITVEKDKLESQIRLIAEAECAGFVVFATEMEDEDMPCFEKLGIPFVLLDNYFIDKMTDCVKVNNDQGTYIAVKYLHDLGHRRVGYLSSGLRINSFAERRASALRNMELLGMNDGRPCSYVIGYPHDCAELGMNSVLDSASPENLPTAFLTDNDLVAIGAMRALIKRGIRVPEDISIMGFDDRPICTMVEPQLSTVHLHRTSFGGEAVEQLLHIMKEDRGAPRKIEINSTLVIRDSVAEPRC